jgi:hypothetical protein
MLCKTKKQIISLSQNLLFVKSPKKALISHFQYDQIQFSPTKCNSNLLSDILSPTKLHFKSDKMHFNPTIVYKPFFKLMFSRPKFIEI